MTRRKTAATLAIVGCVALTACTSEAKLDTITPPAATTSTSTSPPMAVTVSPAPPQPARLGSSVSYDPCFTVGDQPVASLGFDAGTRSRSDFVADHYALIGCKFNRMEDIRGNRLYVGALTVLSSNLDLDDYSKRDDFVDKRATSINGRAAISYRLRGSRDRCSIALTGSDGTIEVTVVSSALTLWVACDHIEEAAQTIETVLPKTK